MSMIDTVLKLQPKDGSSVALREAADRATAKLADLERQLAKLAKERDAYLLSGTRAAIEAADKAYAEMAETVRRVLIMLSDMKERLDAVLASEANERLTIEKLEQDFQLKAANFVERWQGYKKLALEIRELMLLGQGVRDARRQLVHFANAAKDRGNPRVVANAYYPETGFLFGPADRTILDLVVLPNVDGGFTYSAHNAIWMTPATAVRFHDQNVTDQRPVITRGG